MKLDLEIAVDQQTRARDQTFEGVPATGNVTVYPLTFYPLPFYPLTFYLLFQHYETKYNNKDERGGGGGG